MECGETAEIIYKINDIIVNPIIILLFAIALLVFLWGVAEFILNMGSEMARSNGRKHMFWGIIGFAIMVSVWVIIGIIKGTFGIDCSTLVQ